MNQVITIKEAAKIKGLKQKEIKNKIKSGKLNGCLVTKNVKLDLAFDNLGKPWEWVHKLTLKEAARQKWVSISMLKRRIKKKKLNVVKIGKEMFVLNDYLFWQMEAPASRLPI